MYKLNNPAAVTMPYEYVLYSVVTDYRKGKPVSCKIETNATTLNPACVLDHYDEQLSKTHHRETVNFFTMRSALEWVEIQTENSALRFASNGKLPTFRDEATAVRVGKEYDQKLA